MFIDSLTHPLRSPPIPIGARLDEKELEPWDSGANGGIDIELDTVANGWDPNEMFRKNQDTFGVTSTFDDSLASYTVPLDKVDSQEYKDAEAKAEALAAEIENNPMCRDRLDLENGDEEALFAAVERPSDQDHRNDRDREREREREDRDRDRDRDRGNKSRANDFQLRETMSSDRYITKQTRASGPQLMHLGMSSQGGGGGGRDRDRDGMMQGGGMSGGAGQGGSTQSTAALILAGGLKNSGPAASANAATDTSSKYGGGSMVKRKTVPQGGKVRFTPELVIEVLSLSQPCRAATATRWAKTRATSSRWGCRISTRTRVTRRSCMGKSS